MSKKLTEWFPAGSKPELPGIYELEGLPFPFLRWTGSEWRGAFSKPSDAEGRDGWSANYANSCRWRGLAKNPDRRVLQ